MTVQIKKSYILVGIAALCMIIFLLGRYGYRRELRGAENALNEARDTIRQYSVVIAGKQKEVTELRQIVTTKDIAIEQGLIEKDKYKRLYYRTIQSNTELTAKVELLIDSIKAIKPQIIYVTNTETQELDSFPCVRLPYDWVFQDRWVKAVGHVDELAETTLKLEMPVMLTVVMGEKKKGNIPTVSILEDNPYLFVQDIRSVNIPKPKKWHENRWLNFGLGVATASAVVFLVK